MKKTIIISLIEPNKTISKRCIKYTFVMCNVIDKSLLKMINQQSMWIITLCNKFKVQKSIS